MAAAWWALLGVLAIVMDSCLLEDHVLHRLGRALYPDAE
jgi:hypothetical protein